MTALDLGLGPGVRGSGMTSTLFNCVLVVLLVASMAAPGRSEQALGRTLPRLLADGDYCGNGNVGIGVCENPDDCCSDPGYCAPCSTEAFCGNGDMGNGVCQDSSLCCVNGYCDTCATGTCGGGFVGDGQCPDASDCCSADGYCSYCGGYGTCGGGTVGDGACANPNDCCSPDGFCAPCSFGEGDPHFSGFDKSWFDFPGYPDAVFAVLSSPQYQVNALFSNLGNARVVNNYMTQVGFLTPGGAVVVEVASGGGSLAMWLAGQRKSDLAPQMLPAVSYRVAPGLVARLTAQHPKGKEGVTIDLIGEELAVSVFSAAGEPWLDLSLHLRSPAFPDAHGIVGQTWRGGKGVAPRVVNGTHVLEGAGDADYEVTDGILGARFAHTLFKGKTYASEAGAKVVVAVSSSTGMVDAPTRTAGGEGVTGGVKTVRRSLIEGATRMRVVEPVAWVGHAVAAAGFKA